MIVSTLSSLPLAETLTGKELMELVQDGKNVKLPLHDLLPDSLMQDAPSDTKQYARINGKWEVVNPASKNHVFATMSTNMVLDLKLAQLFKVTATEDRALAFKNPPKADEGMDIIVVVVDNIGIVTWPSGINWEDDGMPPTLGDQWTIVRLIYDGLHWRGLKAAKK